MEDKRAQSDAKSDAHFADKLRLLLHEANIDRHNFIHDFAETADIDRRTPAAWFRENDVPRTPKRGTLAKLAKYFESKLKIAIPTFYFELPYESFERLIAERKRRAPPLALAIDADPHQLPLRIKRLLAGTYTLYRPALGHEKYAVKEIATIGFEESSPTQTVKLFGMPNTAADDPTVFKGALFRADRVLQAIVTESGGRQGPRPMLTYSFPLTMFPQMNYYGIRLGYSELLGEIAASLVIAIRISRDFIEDAEARRLVRMIDLGSPEAAQLRRISDQQHHSRSILTVDQGAAREWLYANRIKG